MSSNSSKQSLESSLYSAPRRPRLSKRPRFRLGKLNRRRSQLKEAKEKKKRMMVVVKAEIKMKNLKLYMENQSIIEENEKLRKKAMLLHKENQALFSQLQEKLSKKN
ncbi:Protein LITTLE ZIPPER 2 [Quillaja saponaria]|uniref:Protein LITTLE ZIPPER 2 n=1 Tax=Quillaja saponaria TaxID=32244 RepID=A0AAD7PNZ8_QUISA|nr:Protein LITTLE ZIPPER 2 [Quillaja saponaria]